MACMLYWEFNCQVISNCHVRHFGLKVLFKVEFTVVSYYSIDGLLKVVFRVDFI